MRKRDFIIFFSIVFSIYGLINFYIFLRGLQAIANDASLHAFYIVVFLVLSLSFIVGRFVERVNLSWFSAALVWLGSLWLAAMVYFLLFVVAIDLLRVINYFIPFFPAFLTEDIAQTKGVAMLIVSALVAIIVLAGFLNARRPRVKILNLSIPKNGHPMKAMNLVAVSDIHLGTIVCKSRLEKIISEINKLRPDLVLLPGDVVDEDVAPVIKQNLGETLRTIRSRFGVVAITGNHEYIGGADAACRYLMEHGITILRDSSIKINDSVYVVGREDFSSNRFSGRRRKSLQELLASIDQSYPVILMDHQPFRLEEAASHGIDLQISGHTHHGQLWPFNFITKKVYELSWGYKKKGATHVYVSCGVGTWGPPVRTGSHPEIVNIQLAFE
jgi:hypothetical protein